MLFIENNERLYNTTSFIQQWVLWFASPSALVIFFWNHTSCAHTKGLFLHFPNSQFSGTHLGPFPSGSIPCSSRRLKCQGLRIWCTCPGRSRSCIHHKSWPSQKAARRNHKLRISHHISRTAARLQCLVIFYKKLSPDDVLPYLIKQITIIKLMLNVTYIIIKHKLQ